MSRLDVAELCSSSLSGQCQSQGVETSPTNNALKIVPKQFSAQLRFLKGKSYADSIDC